MNTRAARSTTVGLRVGPAPWRSAPVPQTELSRRRAAMPRAIGVLNELEQRWRDPLRAVSLVAELDAADEDARAATRALGFLYEEVWEAEDRQRLLKRYPACLVVALPSIGALEYVQGNYWTGVWQVAGITPSQSAQAAWGRAFRSGLDRFNLARFEGLPQVNVSEIMIHAGVPAYCLADFLDLLLQRQVVDPDLTANAFLSWATAPGRVSRLSEVDKPVQRFLQFGGDYAEDFIDRCLELLDRLRRPEFDTDGLRIPARVIAEARSLAEDGFLDLWKRRSQARSVLSGREQPRLLLEPFGRGMLLWLPPIEGAANGQAVWHVQVDGDVHIVHSRSVWPGASETAPATSLPLDQPARQALVRSRTAVRESEIDIVDASDPLLVFTEEGRRVPPPSALPPEPVWVLHPASAEFDGSDLEVRGSITELEEVPAPYGWAGWRLHRVDLAEASGLRLGAGRWRTVQGARRARLEAIKPLRDARTAYDTPVLATAPRLLLPADPGVATGWSVCVRRPGASTSLMTFDVTVEHDELVDPWDGIPRPLVGSFEIVVRGPLGRGLNRTLEITEGLATHSQPMWREIRPTGLDPAVVHATASVPVLQIEPAAVRLTAEEASAYFTVSGPDSTATIRVTPPHMAVARAGAGERSDWSLRPLRLATESLDDGKLLVRLPAAIPAELIVRVGDSDLQIVQSESTGGQPLARFDLRRIADTVRHHGSAHLDVRVETLRYPIAGCQPRRLAESITLDGDGHLVLSGALATEGLAAGCYQVYAPWRTPVGLPVDSTLRTGPLPAHLRHGGPLIVTLRVEDPWLPVPWPGWSGVDNTFAIAGGSWSPKGLEPGEAQLSGFLAGASAYHGDAASVPFAAVLYQRNDDLGRSGITADVRETAAAILAAHPREALEVVTFGELSASAVVAPLIHAGLAALPRRPYLERDQELRLWSVSPLAAVLASAHALNGEYAEALHEQVIATCGPVASALLRGEPDPFAQSGTFDEVTECLAQLSPERVDNIWRAAAVVPRGILGSDERAVAARELFDVRNRPGVRRVARDARKRLAELAALIGQTRGKSVLASIEARGSRDGWLALPALSLALAIAARISARDQGSFARYTKSLIPLHATLARHAPRLVTVDVLLAELLLTGADA